MLLADRLSVSKCLLLMRSVQLMDVLFCAALHRGQLSVIPSICNLLQITHTCEVLFTEHLARLHAEIGTLPFQGIARFGVDVLLFFLSTVLH